MKRIWILMLVGLINLCAEAQYNLVPNPSFEVTTNTSNCYGPIEFASQWFNPTNTSPDLYTWFPSFCNGTSSVNNPNGFQIARTGNAYVGIYTIVTLSITKEYIAINLSDTLKNGQCYYAELYLVKANRAQYATNRMGFYFTDDTTGYKFLSGNISVTPQINSQGSVYADTLNWTKLSGTFVANGGEKFLLLETLIPIVQLPKFRLTSTHLGMAHIIL